MNTKFKRVTSEGTVEFEHENSMVVFMALECIDLQFSYEMYESYMMQWKPIPTLPEQRYLDLYAIVANH